MEVHLTPDQEAFVRQAIETGRITSCSWRHPLLRGLILATGTGGALALAPSDPTKLYVGTGESTNACDSFFGVGVYRIDNVDSEGLWVVNRLCDLVEARSGTDGTTVRMHMALPPPPVDQTERVADIAAAHGDRRTAAGAADAIC